MKYPKVSIALIYLQIFPEALSACPFGNSNDLQVLTEVPDDDNHQNAQPQRIRRRRLASLSEDPTTRQGLKDIISRRAKNNEKRYGTEDRSLQEECLSEETYDAIDEDISEMSAAIADVADRGHFFGGIVRLAAHDFMDYDRNAESDPSLGPALGPDGCLDFSHAANAGLPSLWCDSCPLTELYNTSYSSMSTADFWIAAANAVIRQTSIDSGVDLKSTYQWGRVDHVGDCIESSVRLPEAHSCTEVEGTFIDRMSLEWRDAVALSGGHTLGRGDQEFSGHHGIWVDTVEESIVSTREEHCGSYYNFI